MTAPASLAVHVCSRDAPDRLATLLTDLTEVVRGLPCSVRVYDDSTTGSYRAVCAQAPLPVDYFGEDRRQALVGDARRLLGVDSDLLAGSRPFGSGEWDLAGCRFTAMLDAAMATGSSALHLFLDDDLRLLPCRYADRDFIVDTEALRRHLFGSTIPHDRLVAAGVPYAGRADIALLEHVDASEVDGVVPALVTSSPFVHRDSPGFSGGFLLTNQLSLRTVPLSRWYDEDWIWLRQLRLAGGELRPLDAPVVHAGDRTVAVSLASLRYQFEGEVVDSAVRLCAEAGGPFEACLDYVPQALELHIGRVEATLAGRSTRRHADVVGQVLACARETSVASMQDALRAHVERSHRWASAFDVVPGQLAQPVA